ncbi:MAG: bifunctional (p)ppGpp synthetase/guanosine-3',5'-bis(diphosphate) 3'-pyrophosphohydrolase [Pseudomonadota bacterium]
MDGALSGPEHLIALVQSYNPRANAELIERAFAFGEAMHDGQYRRSGEPYFTHPVEVATILAAQALDDSTIVTALLHDTIEDTRASYMEVADEFGEEIAELVDGVTKLTQLQLSSTETKQAENFRKLFMATSRDIRVVLVKLADRLHNMRTIRAMAPEKQHQKARETMDIYAPLAGRMGMQSMREELEDLAFQVLNPEGRNSIIRRFITLQKETGDVMTKIIADIELEMKKVGIEAEVHGRAKKPYSIWRKMQTKQLSFSRLSDIYGFRVIVGEEADCYLALGAIHGRWKAVPGRFKDYISQPKENGYRSLHTAVSGRNGRNVEVQIRTREMHEVAESGVAATWSYRDGERVENPFAVDPAKWMERLSEHFGDNSDDEDFLEAVKLEMYSDQVFCFTPKGDVIRLPKGATPLDFAYAVHTRIGNQTVSAKVDGIRVPLWTRLKNGQSVSIITAEGQKPQVTWIDIAATGRAKSAIRRSLRDEDRERFIKLGHELTRTSFESVGRSATVKVLRVAAKALGFASSDDLLERVGSSEVASRDVVRAVYPDLAPKPRAEIDPERAVIGLSEDQSFLRAPCCQPVPGERIVGITFRGKGVVVHAIDCENLQLFEDEPERWVDIRWQEGRHGLFNTVSVEVTISNDAGVLGRICTLIGEQSANISDLTFLDKKPDFYRLVIDVDLRDTEHLHTVMTVLEADPNVAEVLRYRDPARLTLGAEKAQAS